LVLAAAAPNVLFLMCDSMDGRVVDARSPVSHAVELPFLRDFFAQHGTQFLSAYANSPQCVPSRSSMCTGRRTDQIRAWSNSKGIAASPDGMLDDECVSLFGAGQCREWASQQNYSETIFSAMAGLGYHVNLYGKVDIGAGVQNDKAFKQQTSATGWHGGPSIGIQTRSADIRRPTKQEPLTITSDHDNNVHPEDWATVQRCEDWVNELPSAAEGKPFFLYCSVNIPHPAFQTNATWLAKVDEDKIQLPPWRDGFPEQWHQYDQYMAISKHVEGSYTDQQIKKVRKTYYAMCAETDYLLERVWRAVEAKGYSLENTYVVFVSDHGEMNMEHRQVWKNSMYEASVRIPFQIAGPGIAQGHVSTELVSLLDVLPTLVDMGGAAPRRDLVGTSLLPLARGETPPLNRSVIAQYHSNMGNTGAFMVRWGPWKYVTFGRHLSAYATGYPARLFHVATDPDEMHDVAQDHPQVCAQLEGELAKAFDAQHVDNIAKQEDWATYKQHFAGLPEEKLRAQFARVYHGFDDADWAKVQRWVKEISALGVEQVVV